MYISCPSLFFIPYLEGWNIGMMEYWLKINNPCLLMRICRIDFFCLPKNCISSKQIFQGRILYYNLLKSLFFMKENLTCLRFSLSPCVFHRSGIPLPRWYPICFASYLSASFRNSRRPVKRTVLPMMTVLQYFCKQPVKHLLRQNPPDKYILSGLPAK